MDAFPLTTNGKIDRRALPEPSDDAFAREAYEEPQGEVESALASIWADLLGLDRVSRHDSFFALGGHSLLAVQMISKLQRLGYSLSVRALFDTPALPVLAQSVSVHSEIAIPPNRITHEVDRITPEHLPLIDLTQTEIDHITQHVSGGHLNIQDIYPLSPLQDGILFHHLMAKTGDPYLLYMATSFPDRVSLDIYLSAIQQIVDRHDVLRTSFIWENLSTPAQVVWRYASLSITEVQLDPADGPIAQQLKARFHSCHYRMNLKHAPLLKYFTALDQTTGDWILVQLQHHLTGDHSTMDILNSEIWAILEGRGPSLPPAEPYRNFIAQVRLGGKEKVHERFFTEMLADFVTPSLPFGLTDTFADATMLKASFRSLPQELNKKLRGQAKRLNVSLASICHLAWALVVARSSGQKQVVFGTVLLGRMQTASRAMGVFINNLPIRIDVDDKDSTRAAEESVRETHSRLAALLEHEHASLALAQRCSGIKEAGVPLFSSLLNYRHNTAPATENPELLDQQLVDIEEFSNYPLAVSIEDNGESLGVTAQAVVSRIDPPRVCAYMQQALESLADALENDGAHLAPASVAELDVVPVEERALQIETWNMTEQHEAEGLDHEACLHHLFEKHAERTPKAVAVVFKDQSLTYGEANERANRLAHRLARLGVQSDSLVGICVERSLEMIISILAVLKVGGAYVPLDPAFARDRLRDTLLDAAPMCLIADRAGREALGGAPLESMPAVLDPADVLEEHLSSDNIRVPRLTPSHLAYVIYTSGSTGQPKGVMVDHKGVVNLNKACRSAFGLGLGSPDSTRTTQFFSFAFDGSVCEIFPTLCSGGTLHLLQDSVRQDISQLWKYIEEYAITHAIVTPSVLQDCRGLTTLSNATTFVLAGEALSPSVARALKALVPNGEVINAYGPTEATVASTFYKVVVAADIDNAFVPIGRPVSNKRIYILDQHRRPLPLGSTGEVYIGGIGVARGYLNRSDLTAECFLPDPYAEGTDARMYKTGDLARYMPDGNIVFLGREDQQVKIRGFRIELGEIEARLVEHPRVLDVVVVASRGDGEEEDGDERLVAYVIEKRRGKKWDLVGLGWRTCVSVYVGVCERECRQKT